MLQDSRIGVVTSPEVLARNTRVLRRPRPSTVSPGTTGPRPPPYKAMVKPPGLPGHAKLPRLGSPSPRHTPCRTQPARATSPTRHATWPGHHPRMDPNGDDLPAPAEARATRPRTARTPATRARRTEAAVASTAARRRWGPARARARRQRQGTTEMSPRHAPPAAR